MRRDKLFLPGRIAFPAMLLLSLSARVAPAQVVTPVQPVDTLLYIQHITVGTPACDTCAPGVCPGEPVRVTVTGIVPGCVTFRGLRELAVVNGFQGISAEFVVDTCGHACPTLLRPFEGSIDLAAESVGQHSLLVDETGRSCPDTSVASHSASRLVTYEVLPACGLAPPPLDSLARTLTLLRVVPEPRCPGDSLTLQLLTNGCPPCVHLTGLGPDPARGILASVEWRPLCVNVACRPETLSLGLGRFAAGSYSLTVFTDVHVLREAGADTTISYRTDLTFEVARSCDTTIVGCLHSSLPPIGTPLSDCSLRVPPGGRGDVLVPVRNDLRGRGVAGVQGFLGTSGPFHVRDIAYAGAASGVHVSWTQDGAQSRFVVFGSTPDVVPPGTSDLLRVTVAADSVAPAATPLGSLGGLITLASGPNGEQVPLCAEPLPLLPALRLCIDRAALGCDVNGDGHLDVRDLVLMARCLEHAAADSTARSACFDCDGDGSFGIPDLFCCAREILRGPGLPPDSTHVVDGLVVSMDAPSREPDGIHVRLHVRGASSLGAALIRVRYPVDRWQVVPPASLDTGFPAGWLPLADAGEAGLLRLGALRLSDAAADEFVYDLRALPVPGAAEDGTVSVEGADLTGPDGSMLKPAGALPSADLSTVAPATVVELSAARPNPFGHSTTFEISLPRDADVELAVHDLAGRRVATLVHERLAAGRRTYTWDGAGARDGVYFVRLTVDGRALSSRVALLRGAP